MGSIAIRDEDLQGSVMHELILQFKAETITVAELIASRVRAEVAKYETNMADHANNMASQIRFNLVQPSDIENRIKQKQPKKIDVDKQIDTALKAFDSNGFFILVDDEQVEFLHEKIMITDKTIVSFVKLTPLVGG